MLNLSDKSAKKLNLNRLILGILLILLCRIAISQEIKTETTAVIKVSSSDSGPFLNEMPEIASSKYTAMDTIRFKLACEKIDLQQEYYTIFLSDAEIQELTIADQKFYSGKYQNSKQLSKKWDYRHFSVPSKLLVENEINAKCYNLTTNDFSISPSIFSSEILNQGLLDIIEQSKTGIFFTVFFLGAIFIFIVYTIGLTIQTNNPDFRYYAYYLVAILLHNSIQADAFLKIFALFPRNPIWYHNLNEFLQMFIYASFMLFIKVFLDLKMEQPVMNKIVNYSLFSTIAFGFLFLGTALFTRNFHFLQNYLSILWIVVALLGTIIVVGVYRNSNNPVRYYIMAGSILLLLGSILELLSSLKLIGGYNWNIYAVPEYGWYPFNYTQLAILGETVCFALGIGYKIRMKENEYFELKQNEIVALKSNEEKIALENQMLEKELTALRSQMNPHFLFNSLASINDFIMHENPKDASRYLTKFAKLMRIILNHSKQETISLADELSAINLYIELERLRYKEKFEYQLDVDQNVQLDNILIPSMIIQPYIENAIKHGFNSIKGGGKLKLLIQRLGDTLQIEIDDNGIGRISSNELKTEIEKERKSHGLDITSNRLDLINKLHKSSAKVDITDKYDGEKPVGTKVILKLSIINKQES